MNDETAFAVQIRTSIGSAYIASINSCTLSRVSLASSSSSFNFVSSKTPQSNAVRRAMSYLQVTYVKMKHRKAVDGWAVLQIVALRRLETFAAETLSMSIKQTCCVHH